MIYREILTMRKFPQLTVVHWNCTNLKLYGHVHYMVLYRIFQGRASLSQLSCPYLKFKHVLFLFTGVLLVGLRNVTEDFSYWLIQNNNIIQHILLIFFQYDYCCFNQTRSCIGEQTESNFLHITCSSVVQCGRSELSQTN